MPPEHPATPERHFDEAWQAQALALADSMVRAGHFTPTEWSDTLGARLAAAVGADAPDTLATYYTAVLEALEELSAARASITAEEQARRRTEWEAAYLRTPHGQPVTL